MTTAPPSRRRWPLLVVAALCAAVAGVVLMVLLLTSPAPWVPPRPAPTPEQVGAGRDALVQLRGASAIPAAHPITLGPDQLDGIAALASHGLRPDRLALTVRGGALHITGSHALPGGRWLNAAVVAVRSGRGFPATHLTIGHLSLTDRWSRAILNVGRRVLAWRVSISLDVGFCIEALEEALARYGKPDIFNSDQGSQFTSTAFTAVLHREQIAISMDGKGRWRDNVFVERLWRSVKYEEVYLNAYASVPEARVGICHYLGFYNAVRPHSALGGRTPDQIYFEQPLLAAA